MRSPNVKYKCPYCEKRYNNQDLIIHVDEEHEDMIPENYSSMQIVFNYINKKPLNYHGKCTECGNDTNFDLNKGRYNRQCDRPACKESYLKKFESNMVRMRGVSRISSTPEGQEKMLANRKISGTYKFQNGKEKTYTGSYELNALKFMDQVMNIDPDDIMCPGPVLEYEYQGKRHFYITDFYYIPYNLIIEVKDGGKNPNRRNMPEYREKQIAKEKYIIKNTDFAYLRLTDNDLSQLLSVFMDLKMQLKDNTGKRTIHVNETININEGHLLNEPDIYYNKDKFDSGEINLCFITGHSGSGKSTMGRDMQGKDNVEHYELDDLNQNYKFTDEDLKEYGDLIYSFFKGPGKKYRYYSYEDMQNCTNPLDDAGDEFDKYINRDFINYAMKYSNSHKKSKFVLEGIWIYFFMKPEELKDYAVYIKGTSRLISAFRARKRDVSDEKNKVKRFVYSIKGTFQTITNKYSLEGERLIKKYREYFTKLDSVNEAMDALMTGYIPGFDSAGSVYIVNYMKNNVFSGDEERGYGVSNTPKLTSMFSRDKEGKLVQFPDNFLEECKYDVYMVKITPEEVSKRIGKYIGEFVEEGFLYESIFGKKMYTYDQIMLEESVIPVIDFYKGLEMFSEVTKNLILQDTKLTENPIYFNENSQMVFDIGNSEDRACISYSTLRDGKVYVESVEYPELYLEADSINSIEAKFLQLLSSYRKEVK